MIPSICLIPLGWGMRCGGADQRPERVWLEQRVPADHPLRAIRDLIDAARKVLSRDFARLYARRGRPSIPPERLLRALLLQAFYTVRSELGRRKLGSLPACLSVAQVQNVMDRSDRPPRLDSGITQSLGGRHPR